MGILTDPALTKNKFTKHFIKHTGKTCIVFYIIGFIWFLLLAHNDLNHATYLSENALSPGLVYSEIKQESARYADSLLEELIIERKKYKTTIPYPWLIAKMKQIGLETYTHNFTINYPFGGGKQFTGKNVYGILRAPRIGSTEGIIFSTPYRPPNLSFTEITPSVPLLLAFADFARKKNYWAKDIIFLVTDHEQLGMHAWLQAYFKGDQGLEKGILDHGSLLGRAGALQAAINLEIQDFDSHYLNVKIEGLNGQLPNLDLFNLIQRLAVREGIPSGYKQTKNKKRSVFQQSPTENIKHLLNMIIAQANGVPTGNHGLFHRYRVEALTLEGVKREHPNSHHKINGCISLLKTIEGISRSLNNLLERFHQSFFFYILVANDRFVSIGDFIPSLICMTGSLYIKAFLIWMGFDKDKKQEDNSSSLLLKCDNINLPFIYIAKVFSVSLSFGIIAFYLPQSKIVNDIFFDNNIKTEICMSVLLIAISISGFIIPYFITLTKYGFELLHIVSLLYLGSALTVLGLLNFALALLLSIIIVPLAIFINTEHRGILRIMSTIYTLLLHPLLLTYLVAFILTMFSFKEISITDLAIRTLTVTAEALTFSILDWMTYGNWLFVVNSFIFYPAWILFWIVNIARRPENKVKED